MAYKDSNKEQFDPFKGERLCRDIRNDLSESLMKSIELKSIEPSLKIAKKYQTKDLKPYLLQYIDNTVPRYKHVIDQIASVDIKNNQTYEVAMLLWDQELFFEVHEWLESKWYTATGEQRNILQALIRAAGTYVHLKYGRSAGADKMSRKAIEALSRLQKYIPAFFNARRLLENLHNLTLPPAKLGADHFIKDLQKQSYN